MGTTNTTYMNLPVPNVGSEPGPTYATDVNTCLSILDQHNHTAGSGQQIPTDGIIINGDLPFNSYNATRLRSSRFTAQGSPIAAASDLGCLYVSGADLWYNDTAGNQVQITAAGVVNATSSGISSGTASASFSAGVLVVKGSSTSGANVEMKSLVLTNSGNLTNLLTLQAPSLSGSNTQTLPATPAAAGFMQIDTSGNMSAIIPLSAGITGSNIAAATITGSNIAGTTITAANIANSTITGTQIASSINLDGTPSANSNNIVISLVNGSTAFGVLYGTVDSTGVGNSGPGFTCSKIGTGTYTVTFNKMFNGNPAVTITPAEALGGSASERAPNISNLSASGFTVKMYTTGATASDIGFAFIAIGTV